MDSSFLGLHSDEENDEKLFTDVLYSISQWQRMKIEKERRMNKAKVKR